MVLIDMDMPKSCLHCPKRKVIHRYGQSYQMCGLNEDGYLSESWFTEDDLTEDFKARQCPLIEVRVELHKIDEAPAITPHHPMGVKGIFEIVKGKLITLKKGDENGKSEANGYRV